MSIIIVGAGECGTRAALALRDAGHAGPVVLLGAEPHPPYERPPLSKEAMTGAAPPAIAGAERLVERGIDVRLACTAVAIDRAAGTVQCAGGDRLGYEKLLLATGARPRVLPLPGADGANVRMLRTLADAAAIRAALGPGRRLAIVGGGFIGLEIAAAARRLGTDVAVVEAAPRLLARGVPADIAAILLDRHRAEGVDVRLAATLAAIERAGVVLGDGDTVPADLVVIGVGAVPNTELAAAAGLAIDNGIAVDATLATADPAIFAAGDCASVPHPLYDGRRVRLESWRSAQEHGALAARNLLGAGEPIAAVPWFWSDQYDLTLQIAGLAEGAAHHIRRDLGGGAFVTFHLAEGGRLLAASGIGEGNAVAKDIRLAEMLIARRAAPDPAALADPATNLKSLLRAPVAA